MKILFLLSLAFVAGCLLPIQGGINSQLAQHLKHPLQATFISFLGGILLISVLLVLMHPPLSLWSSVTKIPWYLFLGGIPGVLLVTVVLVLAPRLGIAAVLAGAITGQLVFSVVTDHFGLFGLPVHSISPARIGGVLLLLAGMFLMQK